MVFAPYFGNVAPGNPTPPPINIRTFLSTFRFFGISSILFRMSKRLKDHPIVAKSNEKQQQRRRCNKAARGVVLLLIIGAAIYNLFRTNINAHISVGSVHGTKPTKDTAIETVVVKKRPPPECRIQFANPFFRI